MYSFLLYPNNFDSFDLPNIKVFRYTFAGKLFQFSKDIEI